MCVYIQNKKHVISSFYSLLQHAVYLVHILPFFLSTIKHIAMLNYLLT